MAGMTASAAGVAGHPLELLTASLAAVRDHSECSSRTFCFHQSRHCGSVRSTCQPSLCTIWVRFAKNLTLVAIQFARSRQLRGRGLATSVSVTCLHGHVASCNGHLHLSMISSFRRDRIIFGNTSRGHRRREILRWMHVFGLWSIWHSTWCIQIRCIVRIRIAAAVSKIKLIDASTMMMLAEHRPNPR